MQELPVNSGLSFGLWCQQREIQSTTSGLKVSGPVTTLRSGRWPFTTLTRIWSVSFTANIRMCRSNCNYTEYHTVIQKSWIRYKKIENRKILNTTQCCTHKWMGHVLWRDCHKPAPQTDNFIWITQSIQLHARPHTNIEHLTPSSSYSRLCSLVNCTGSKLMTTEQSTIHLNQFLQFDINDSTVIFLLSTLYFSIFTPGDNKNKTSATAISRDCPLGPSRDLALAGWTTGKYRAGFKHRMCRHVFFYAPLLNMIQ